MTRRDEIAALVEELWRAAEASSRVQRMMAEGKSLRNSDGKHSDLYMWSEPKDTLEGRTATLLESLALPPAAEREGDYVLVPREPTDAMLDEASGVQIAVYPTNFPSGWTATNHDEAREIWSAMLAAASPPQSPDAASPGDPQ